MLLNALLQQQLEASNAKFPPQALDVIAAAQDEMRQLGLEAQARGVGDYVPNATLKNSAGEDVSLSALNENGPLIITFYRGGWCPYCNLELWAYQERLSDIIALGGTLVAVTPEKPDNALSTAEKNALAFPVLTDKGHAFAKVMGVAFEMPVALQNLFSSFGTNLPDLNANTGWTLPMPATFVVDCNDRIVLADVDVDYTRRLEPAKAIDALRSCLRCGVLP